MYQINPKNLTPNPMNARDTGGDEHAVVRKDDAGAGLACIAGLHRLQAAIALYGYANVKVSPTNEVLRVHYVNGSLTTQTAN